MHRFTHLLAVLLLISIITACGNTSSVPSSNAQAPEPLASTEPAPTRDAASQPSAIPVAVPTALPTALPTATPAPALPAQIAQVGFYQDDQVAVYGFLLDNPNPAAALTDVRMQMIAYGADNIVLGTNTSSVLLLPPGVQTAMGGNIYLSDARTVERVDVQITAGGQAFAATPEEIPAFPVTNATFHPSTIYDQVSAIVGNPFGMPLTDLYVGIVLFDEAEQIIGGGFTYLPFLLPESSTPFKTSIRSNGMPARIAVSPLLSGLSLFEPQSAASLPPLEVVEQGWGINQQIGFGMVLANPDASRALEDSQYVITAYADDGSILAVDQGIISVILPGARTAIGRLLYTLSDDPAPARVEALIFPGTPTTRNRSEAFSFTSTTFFPDPFGGKVTGMISNPYAQSVSNLELVALVRDANGAIIGAGGTYSTTIPGAGSLAVEMVVAAPPDQVVSAELFANETRLTEFGE